MGSKSLAAKRAKKRVIRQLSPDERTELRKVAIYEGSPHHKRAPNNFGLTPPTDPRDRDDKTLCDEAGIFDRKRADDLWNEALSIGLVSVATVAASLPKHIWVVDPTGQAFEAIYGGSRTGAYHGYPIRSDDPLYEKLTRAWDEAKRANG